MNKSHSRNFLEQTVNTIVDRRIIVFFFQILYIVFGIIFESFDVTILKFMVALGTSVATDYFLGYYIYGDKRFPLGAVNTACGLGLYFRADPIYYMLAAHLAILSKYFLINPWTKRQIFNPSNIAIIFCIFLLPSVTTTEFTQWGSSMWVYILIAVICLSVSYYVKVFDLTVSFLLTYLVLLLAYIPYAPETFSVHHYGMLGPSLIVFSTFMITDPKSIPILRKERIYHGFVLASIFFILEYFGIRYSIFLTIGLGAVLNLGSNYIAFNFNNKYIQIFKKYIGINFVTFLLILGIVIGIFVNLVTHNKKMFSLTQLSPDFLLRGIESSSVVRDPKDPIFKLATESGVVDSDMSTVGSAFADYNNDGYDDLFVSSYFGGTSKLYRNNKDGTFTDVTKESGLPNIYSISAYFADYNNDGLLDLFILFPTDKPKNLTDGIDFANTNSIRVFKNIGNGKFVETTNEVGLGDLKLGESYAASASFADFNNDGKLDFVLSYYGTVYGKSQNTYVLTPFTAMLKTVSDPAYPTMERVLCGRKQISDYLDEKQTFNYDSVFNNSYEEGNTCLVTQDTFSFSTRPYYLDDYLGINYNAYLIKGGGMKIFENVGGKFVEHKDFYDNSDSYNYSSGAYSMVDNGNNFNFHSKQFFQPVSFDYDGDGKMDLFVSVDFGRSMLLKNQGNFKFADVSKEKGIDTSMSGMGVSVADIKDDGDTSIFVSNAWDDPLYTSKDGSKFLRNPEVFSRLGFGWGAIFLDYNLDGYDDIYVANGDAFRGKGVPRYDLSRSFYRRDKLYKNNHNGAFDEDTYLNLPADNLSGKSLSVSDYNNDGTPDIFVGNQKTDRPEMTSKNLLYKNTLKGKNFIKVNLRGKKDNYFGVGARIEVKSDLGKQTKTVLIGEGFQSQSSLTKIFGLDNSSNPVNIKVYWPSGRVNEYKNINVNQTILLTEY